MLSGCRRYQKYFKERTEARQQFRRLNPRRRNGRATPYLEDLSEPQAFTAWLEEDVSKAREIDDLPNPEEDVVCLSQLPSPRATKYRSM